MTYTYDLTNNQIQIIINQYQEYQISDTNNYTLFRAKIKSTTLTIFQTGKILLQGNDISDVQKEINTILNLDIKMINNKKSKNQSVGHNIIGTDEVGTGDYFGGIVVAAAYVEKSKILELTKMGIKDSKLINDEKIYVLGKYLIENIPHSVLLLNNEKYNQITNNGINLNQIKAILHNKVIINFLNKYPNIHYDAIIIDGFCSNEKYQEYLIGYKETFKAVNLIEKAESKYISVAAASIIARYYFLKHLEDLSNKYHYSLLKGASTNVDKLIKKIINEKGSNYLYNFSKINFKNTKKAKENE